MAVRARRIGILTGGGDCPGLNPAIRGAVLRARALGHECVGLLDGWKGMITGQSMPLTPESVEGIGGRGGTILGTSRTNPYKKEGGVQAALATFKKLGLDALIAMGGEDTLGVAAKLFKEHRAPVVGVPKTMDNDLSATDFTFGFDTAATVAVDAAERLLDTGRSHRRIMVLEVMGRHAGWVALYTGIAAGADYVAIPERPVDLDSMAEHLKGVYARKKCALVVASEAVEFVDQGGGPRREELDEFGHAILKKRGVGETLAAAVEERTKIETRVAVIGHIQRGGPPTLFDRILGTRAGVAAADQVQKGGFGKMVALRGTDIVAVGLEEATAKLKTVPESWFELVDTLTGAGKEGVPAR